MIEYRRGTIVLQGGSLPKLHARFAGVHKRGGGANDRLRDYYDIPGDIGLAVIFGWTVRCVTELSRSEKQ